LKSIIDDNKDEEDNKQDNKQQSDNQQNDPSFKLISRKRK
jgi:hypothetical protein